MKIHFMTIPGAFQIPIDKLQVLNPLAVRVELDKKHKDMQCGVCIQGSLAVGSETVTSNE